jgi:hypothetical protein
MENIHNTYKYTPLDRDLEEIRVLELLPGVDPAKIEGRLRIHSLAKPSIYDALSYTWGDPSITKLITLDSNENFHIDAKLERTLHDLRKSDIPLIIWIDAICIDQRNIGERNQQVKLMRAIYEKALMVRIWIDMDIDASAPAFKALENIIAYDSNVDLGKDPKFWDPVIELFGQRYWGRVWIQQEVASGSHLSLLCRRASVPAEGVLALGYTVVEKFKAGELDAAWLPLNNAVGNFKGRYLVEFRYMPLLKKAHLEHKVKYPYQSHLLSMLDNARMLGCQDPRDRVYGMMHLAEDYEHGGIEIDYNRSVTDVYCSVPKYFVERYERYQHSGCLAFLCTVTADSRTSVHVLPSWCPDWSSELQAIAVLDMRNLPFLFAPGKARGQKPSISSNGKILQAQGFRLDTISQMHLDSLEELLRADEPISEIFAGWITTISETVDGPNHFEEISQCLLRCLTAGNEVESDRETWEEVLDLAQDRDAERSWKDVQLFMTPEAVSLLVCITTATTQRLLFKGDSGIVGLIPKEALFDDEIWILFDCPVPVVLRPVDDHFTVVGVAHVDGYMRGEACVDMPEFVKEGERYDNFEIATILLR